MSISSVLSSGLQGVQTGMSITDRAGGRISSMTGVDDSTQMADAMVALREGELQVKLSADVIKVGDEMLGTLIDIRV